MSSEGRFLKLLTALINERRAYFRENFDRSPACGDLISDRWEKARALGFGAGSSVYDNVLILGDVTVGENTWIGPGTVLDGSGGPLKIGSGCSISAGVQIYTHHSVKRTVTGGRAPLETGPVTIADNVYVGPGSIISKGVTIGRQSVIGAQSFVRSSFDDRSFVCGSPARLAGRVIVDPEGADCRIEPV